MFALMLVDVRLVLERVHSVEGLFAWFLAGDISIGPVQLNDEAVTRVVEAVCRVRATLGLWARDKEPSGLWQLQLESAGDPTSLHVTGTGMESDCNVTLNGKSADAFAGALASLVDILRDATGVRLNPSLDGAN